MARFGESFLSAMTRPSFGEGLFTAGVQAGATPGRMAQRQVTQNLQKEIIEARLSGDPARLKAVAQKAAQAGDTQAATLLTQEAVTASQTAANAAKLNVFNQAVQAIPDITTEEGRRQFFAAGAQAGLKPDEVAQRYNNRVGEAYTLKPGEQRMLGGRVVASLPKEAPPETFSTSEPVSWKDAAGNVVLNTVSGNRGTLIEAGSNREVTAEELKGLTKVKQPLVSMTGDSEVIEGLSKSLVDDVVQNIAEGKQAQETLLFVNEARAALDSGGEQALTGIAAEGVDTARRAGLFFLRSLGVSEDDPIYREMNDTATGATRLRTLTQDFVKERLAATKGAISDKEFETFIGSVPNLLQTVDGYKQVLGFMERMAKLKAVKAGEFRNLRADLIERKKSARDVENFKKKWDDFTFAFPVTDISPDVYQDMWNAYKNNNLNAVKITVPPSALTGDKPVTYTYQDVAKVANKKKIPVYVVIRRLLREQGGAVGVDNG